jgi:hypothetical protein
MDEGDLQYVALRKIGFIWSGIPEGSLKPREIQGSTGGLRKPGYMALPKFREALTRVPIRPRSKGNTLIKDVNPL